MLEEGAGELANGFISVGGASTPEIRSKAMEEFIDRYTKKFGEYNDESNTKVYALQYIIDTLKADPKAIDNIDEFKKTIDGFSAPNPYLKDSIGDAPLRRHDLVRPEASARGAAGRQRVQGRQVRDPVRRQRRLTARLRRLDGRPGLKTAARRSSRRTYPCEDPKERLSEAELSGARRMEQVIANGLYLGAQYALIALGLTLIFALMNVLNFAHGQMYVLGGFVTYEVYGLLHWPFVVALARFRR